MPTTFDAETFTARLEAAIGGPEGLDQIERIEFERSPDSKGRYRWVLWREGRRLFVSPGGPADTAGYLAATKTILDCQANIPPTEPTEETSHAPTA